MHLFIQYRHLYFSLFTVVVTAAIWRNKVDIKCYRCSPNPIQKSSRNLRPDRSAVRPRRRI